MPTYRVVTEKLPEGAFDVAGGTFNLEMEALGPVGAEIVETAAESEDEFIAVARDADAIMARGRQMTAKIIESLERCRVIALGSVGADSVDVDAATARGIPVTNVPDVFIEEVADHAMMLILATYRRVLVQDRMARDGRWGQGRPALSQIPRLMGQTLGFVSFGHVARLTARNPTSSPLPQRGMGSASPGG